jgi:hypothetical protein
VLYNIRTHIPTWGDSGLRREREGIIAVTLAAETKRLESLEEEERGEGV